MSRVESQSSFVNSYLIWLAVTPVPRTCCWFGQKKKKFKKKKKPPCRFVSIQNIMNIYTSPLHRQDRFWAGLPSAMLWADPMCTDSHVKLTLTCWNVTMLHGHLGSTTGINYPVLDMRILKNKSRSFLQPALAPQCWSAAEGPFHLPVLSATATAIRRHIYPDVWQTEQTTEVARPQGQRPQTTRISTLGKVSPCQILGSGLNDRQKKRKAQPNSAHNFIFHKNSVVWAPVSVWDRNGALTRHPPAPPRNTLRRAVVRLYSKTWLTALSRGWADRPGGEDTGGSADPAAIRDPLQSSVSTAVRETAPQSCSKVHPEHRRPERAPAAVLQLPFKLETSFCGALKIQLGFLTERIKLIVRISQSMIFLYFLYNIKEWKILSSLQLDVSHKIDGNCYFQI